MGGILRPPSCQNPATDATMAARLRSRRAVELDGGADRPFQDPQRVKCAYGPAVVRVANCDVTGLEADRRQHHELRVARARTHLRKRNRLSAGDAMAVGRTCFAVRVVGVTVVALIAVAAQSVAARIAGSVRSAVAAQRMKNSAPPAVERSVFAQSAGVITAHGNVLEPAGSFELAVLAASPAD